MRDIRPVSSERSDWGLFSPEELFELMRVECTRASRYGYDLACLCVSIDRLGHLQDLYGSASRAELLDALHELLKSSTRDSDFPRCMVDDALVALFPHTGTAGALTLCRRVLKGARRLGFESDGRPIQVTFSIGVATNKDAGVRDLESLLQQAQAGMALARAAGGDRFMRQEQASNEFDQIRRELEDLRTALDRQGDVVREAASVRRVLDLADLPGGGQALLERPEDREFAARMAALFGAGAGSGAEAEKLRQQAIDLALRGIHEERRRSVERQMRDNEGEVDTLRRRVSKLNSSLAATEEELRRVMALKDVDPGVASIYRTVQGLSADAANAKARLDMLNRIFQANVELRQNLQPGSVPAEIRAKDSTNHE
jgi:diguanylate cyclase (GGDEF)-like protein